MRIWALSHAFVASYCLLFNTFFGRYLNCSPHAHPINALLCGCILGYRLTVQVRANCLALVANETLRVCCRSSHERHRIEKQLRRCGSEGVHNCSQKRCQSRLGHLGQLNSWTFCERMSATPCQVQSRYTVTTGSVQENCTATCPLELTSTEEFFISEPTAAGKKRAVCGMSDTRR